MDFETEVVQLPDGGKMTLNWTMPLEQVKQVEGPLKIIVHVPGLGGSSDRIYIRVFCDYLKRSKLDAKGNEATYVSCVLNGRGVSNAASGKSLDYMQFSRNDDWKLAMRLVVQRLDALGVEYELYGVGMSMGGNLLMRYQALCADESKFKAIITFNNPFDLQLASNLMKNTIYEDYVVEITAEWTDRALKMKELVKEAEEKLGIDLIELG